MEEVKPSEDHLTSAGAFVERGIQEACDDACSICLEAFCESDPSTMTSCKHEFHLQCILEWCQRSSQCPMCWQSISLKDAGSQEFLEVVEQERNARMNPPRNTAIFHHPALGDFELQHLPANDSELEERIIQHLAATAAMRRARQLGRREGQRSSRSSTQGRPQFLVFSSNPNPSSASSPVQRAGPGPSPNSPFITIGGDSDITMMASGSGFVANQLGSSSTSRRSPAQTLHGSQDRGGPSDFQSFSESLKSRLSALSLRYKESITKSTRGWKERLFARNSSIPDNTPEVRRDVEPSIGTGSRMMDYREIAEDSRTELSNTSDDASTQNTVGGNSTEVETRAPAAAATAAN